MAETTKKTIAFKNEPRFGGVIYQNKWRKIVSKISVLRSS